MKFESNTFFLFFTSSDQILNEKTVNLLLMVYFGRLKFENCFIFANNETEKIEYTSTFAIVYLFVRYDRCECK